MASPHNRSLSCRSDVHFGSRRHYRACAKHFRLAPESGDIAAPHEVTRWVNFDVVAVQNFLML